MDVQCTSSQQTISLTDPENEGSILFDISVNRTIDTEVYPVLDIHLAFMEQTDDQCQATIKVQDCRVRTATVAYKVIHQESSLRLDPGNKPSTIHLEPSFGDRKIPDGSPAGALAALEYFSNYYFTSNATLIRPKTSTEVYSYETVGSMVRQYAIFPANDTTQHASCGFRWRDATDDLVQSLHEVMFRLAIASAPGE